MGAISITLPVLWGDLDSIGHVNNARYFTWLESARIALFQRVGVATTEPKDIGPVIVTTTCDFEKSVHFPSTIEVRVSVSRIGESSIAMAYEVFDADDKTTRYAKATSVAVLVDRKSGTKVRVPDDIRRAIEQL